MLQIKKITAKEKIIMDNYSKIEEIAKKYEIGLIYLFGSQKDNAKKIIDGKKVRIDDTLTDIDIGVVFAFDLLQEEKRYKLYALLYNELEDIFLPYKLDLVFLQEQHSVFQAEAIMGYCIYSQSEEFKDLYEEDILKRAADFKYVLDKYYEERLEEL